MKHWLKFALGLLVLALICWSISPVIKTIIRKSMVEPLQQKTASRQKVLDQYFGRVPRPQCDLSSLSFPRLLMEYYLLVKYEPTIEEHIKTIRDFVSDEDRKAAHKRNTAMGFRVDPRLAEEDVVKVVGMIEESEILDPRIISIWSKGKNAIEVTTGVESPRCGRGSKIHFRKIGDQWVLSDVSLVFWTPRTQSNATGSAENGNLSQPLQPQPSPSPIT